MVESCPLSLSFSKNSNSQFQPLQLPSSIFHAMPLYSLHTWDFHLPLFPNSLSLTHAHTHYLSFSRSLFLFLYNYPDSASTLLQFSNLAPSLASTYLFCFLPCFFHPSHTLSLSTSSLLFSSNPFGLYKIQELHGLVALRYWKFRVFLCWVM